MRGEKLPASMACSKVAVRSRKVDQHLDRLAGILRSAEPLELGHGLPLELHQLFQPLLNVRWNGLTGLQVGCPLRELAPPLAPPAIDARKAVAKILPGKPLLATAARNDSESGGQHNHESE